MRLFLLCVFIIFLFVAVYYPPLTENLRGGGRSRRGGPQSRGGRLRRQRGWHGGNWGGSHIWPRWRYPGYLYYPNVYYEIANPDSPCIVDCLKAYNLAIESGISGDEATEVFTKCIKEC